MTKDEIADVTRLALGDRIRAAVKAVLEQVIEEEMTEHVGAKYREKTDARTGERNGSYQRGLSAASARPQRGLSAASARQIFAPPCFCGRPRNGR